MPEDAARDLDALAEAFEAAPDTPDAARTRLETFAWAKPTETVLSDEKSALVERRLL